MISFNLNYLLKNLSPNTVTMVVRVSTYELGGGVECGTQVGPGKYSTSPSPVSFNRSLSLSYKSSLSWVLGIKMNACCQTLYVDKSKEGSDGQNSRKQHDVILKRGERRKKKHSKTFSNSYHKR